MSLKIIKFEPRLAKAVWIAFAILCVASAWFFVRWNFANVIAFGLDPRLPESKQVSDLLTQIAPDDPQTHYIAAAILEKTFDADDLTSSLHEYETATALSPNNYLMWLSLGKSRSLNGDTDGAEAAYARALALAPNYASVQWAYGNSLVRQGKTDEGFALIAKAAASSPEYSRTAVVTALQIFDGDLTRVRHALGDSDVTNAALAAALSDQARYDDAYDAWSKLPAADRTVKFQKLGESLAAKMVTAKKFQPAARFSADLGPNDGGKPVVGQVDDGGFENGVKLRNAGIFEWQIAEGAEPQIALSETQKRSGKYSLLMMFNTLETAGFRSVSQTVAVIPGASYEFEAFYRSDLKTDASLKWEIVDAATTAAIARTEPFAPASDWTSVKVKFTVPAGSDGIIIRLARDSCSGPACPMNGKVFFDDISIKRL